MSEIEQLTLLTSIALPEWELHALVTGAIIGSEAKDDDDIVALLEESRPGLLDLVALKTLCTSVRHSLNDESFEFYMVLPDDDEPLANRVAAFGSWCDTFLESFDARNPKLRVDLHELNEPLNDLENFAAVDADVDEDENVETQLFELIEYTKVAVLLINESIEIHLREAF